MKGGDSNGDFLCGGDPRTGTHFTGCFRGIYGGPGTVRRFLDRGG